MDILNMLYGNTSDFKLNTITKKNGKFFMVDTCYTLDHGYETMVFPYDMENDKVASWGELDCDIYDSEEEASEGHADMVKEWGGEYNPNEVPHIEEPKDDIDLARQAYKIMLESKMELEKLEDVIEDYKKTVLNLQKTITNQAGRIDKLERKLNSLNAKQNI